MPCPDRQRGVTLVELIMVMVILGLVSTVSLVFMQRTFAGYGQARDRLLIAEQVRLTLNRFKREARLALPNSARVSVLGGVYYLEFVPVSTAGRYRIASATGSDPAPSCPSDSSAISDNGVLTIGQADTCFKTLGIMDATGVAVGDWVVVFNAGDGYSGSNFYENGASTGGNKAQLTSVSTSATETRVGFSPNAFAWDSPGHRFYVAKNPITYVCDPVAGALTRWSGYAVQASQPVGGLSGLSGASSASLAKKVSACSITYTPASIASQFGLLTVGLTQQTANGDIVSAQMQAQISNVP